MQGSCFGEGGRLPVLLYGCVSFPLSGVHSSSKIFPRLLILLVGYYIQSCPKMLYKGEYGPSELLDPETYEWNSLDEGLKKLLDESKYVCPSAIRAGDGNKTTTEGIGITEGQDKNQDEAQDEDELVDPDPGFIFETKMPGILTDHQLEVFDIGNVNIKLGNVQAQAKVIARATPGFPCKVLDLTREHNRILSDSKTLLAYIRCSGKWWLRLEQRLQER